MPWQTDKALAHLTQHAQGHSLGQCAQYTRQAIEAGGLNLVRHASAKDYGSSLVQAGFHQYTQGQVSTYKAGDVAVIQGFKGHPHGHMAMYDGKHWVSDFQQPTLYPGESYRKAHPPFKIYRNAGVSPQDENLIGNRSAVGPVNQFLGRGDPVDVTR
jgi:hypothetical protein